MADKKRARRVPQRRTEQTKAMVDRLAGHLADGGSLPAFAKVEVFDRSRSYQLWRMICVDLGAQAI